MHIANKLIGAHCHKDKNSSTKLYQLGNHKVSQAQSADGISWKIFRLLTENISFPVNCQPSETDKNNIHAGE